MIPAADAFELSDASHKALHISSSHLLDDTC